MKNYLDAIAEEIRDSVPGDYIPDGPVEGLFRIYAVLALAKGSAVDARDVHNAWSAWMSSQEPDHESLVPFDDLPPETRSEDSPYVQAIRRVVAKRGLRPSQDLDQ